MELVYRRGWMVLSGGGLLGITVKGGYLTVLPQLPDSWPGWSAQWREKDRRLNITVRRGQKRETRLDGLAVERVELRSLTGEHALEVTVEEK